MYGICVEVVFIISLIKKSYDIQIKGHEESVIEEN